MNTNVLDKSMGTVVSYNGDNHLWEVSLDSGGFTNWISGWQVSAGDRSKIQIGSRVKFHFIKGEGGGFSFHQVTVVEG